MHTLLPAPDREEAFSEVDVSFPDAKERMRSAPILEENKLPSLFKAAPDYAEDEPLAMDE